MKLLFISFALFSLTVRLDQTFDLKINQKARVKNTGGVVIAFESVLEDSRCPEGVNCVWSGNAKIRLKVSKKNHQSAIIDLNTDVEPKTASYLNYKIQLVKLKPRTKQDKKIESHEYKATMLITPNSK